ncbi:MAG: hypothetical protein EPN39_09285 [Chitinophagaceae bacterium]|nr:MAG: hypothetical protein EPN39_09285 [Chitinophagaceae bacterium]
MEPDPIYEGVVTFYNLAKHFGFIHSEGWEDIFFYLDPAQFKALSSPERIEVKNKFVRGDEICFNVRYSDKSKGPVAYNLHFIKNERSNRLKELIELHNELPGFIKKIDGNYYIKDKATYLFIPIHISKSEIALQETYENRLNKLVTYSVLKKYKNPEAWKATVTDRKFNEVYIKLKEYKDNRIVLPAKIIKMNRYGYYASLLNGTVNAFMLLNKKGSEPSSFSRGELIEVTIRSVHDSGVLIQLVEPQRNVLH